MTKDKKARIRVGTMEGSLKDHIKKDNEWKAKWNFRGWLFITAIGVGGLLLSLAIDFMRGFPKEWSWIQYTGIALSTIITCFGATMVTRIMKK